MRHKQYQYPTINFLWQATAVWTERLVDQWHLFKVWYVPQPFARVSRNRKSSIPNHHEPISSFQCLLYEKGKYINLTFVPLSRSCMSARSYWSRVVLLFTPLCRSVRFPFSFWRYWAFCLADRLSFHCPCPPSCVWGSCAVGLVDKQ